MAKYLTREKILEANDINFAEVAVPEWGGTVRIRTISGDLRDGYDLYRSKISDSQTNPGYRAFVCAMCCVGEDDKPMFTTKDIQALGEKSSAALDRVFEAADKINGFTSGNIEETAKNSPSSNGAGSTSLEPSQEPASPALAN